MSLCPLFLPSGSYLAEETDAVAYEEKAAAVRCSPVYFHQPMGLGSYGWVFCISAAHLHCGADPLSWLACDVWVLEGGKENSSSNHSHGPGSVPVFPSLHLALHSPSVLAAKPCVTFPSSPQPGAEPGFCLSLCP